MKTKTIYIFICSLIFLILSVTLIFYVHTEISDKIAIVKEYRIKAEKEKLLQPTTKIKVSLENLATQEQIIKSKYVSSTAMVDFIRKLESLAESNSLGISVQKIEYATSEVIEEKYTIQPVSFSLELQGGFNDINSFMTQLTSSDSALHVKEFKLYKTGDIRGTMYTGRIIIEGKTLAI